mgnify:CR=1 FL=1
MGKLKRKGFMLERKIFEISFNSPMGKLKQRIEGGVKIIGYVCFNSPMGKLKQKDGNLRNNTGNNVSIPLWVS